jgi:very-short-patch-repair endonuclease
MVTISAIGILSDLSVCPERYSIREDSYIAGFACLDANLIIELNGASHYLSDAVKHDTPRTAFLEVREYCVPRFRNDEIFNDLYRAMDVIMRDLPPSVPSLRSGRLPHKPQGYRI